MGFNGTKNKNEKDFRRTQAHGNLFHPVEPILEVRAVHTAALWAANLVDQRKFKRAVAVGSRTQVGCVDVVAETNREAFVVETGAQDQGVHQLAVVEAVGNTRPGTQLEGLLVAAAVAQQELEGVTGVDLKGGALEERHHTWYQTEFAGYRKLTTRVEGELAVQRNAHVAVERLVGAVQVAEGTAKVEVVVLIKHAEPQSASGEVDKHEVWIVDYATCQSKVNPAIAVVLAGPLQVGAVDAALAHAEVGTQRQVVRLAAVSAHFFGIRTGKPGLEGGKLGCASLVAP